MEVMLGMYRGQKGFVVEAKDNAINMYNDTNDIEIERTMNMEQICPQLETAEDLLAHRRVFAPQKERLDEVEEGEARNKAIMRRAIGRPAFFTVNAEFVMLTRPELLGRGSESARVDQPQHMLERLEQVKFFGKGRAHQ